MDMDQRPHPSNDGASDRLHRGWFWAAVRQNSRASCRPLGEVQVSIAHIRSSSECECGRQRQVEGSCASS